jgi:hypothetical protein
MAALASVDSLCAALAALGNPTAAAAVGTLCLLACEAGGALDMDKHGAAPGSVMTWSNKHGRKNQQWLLRRVPPGPGTFGTSGDFGFKIHSAENPELLLTATPSHATAAGGEDGGCTLRAAAEGAAGLQLWTMVEDMRGPHSKSHSFQLCLAWRPEMGWGRPPWLGSAGASAFTLMSGWGSMAGFHRAPTDAEAWHLEDPAGVLTPQALLDLIRAAEVPEWAQPPGPGADDFAFEKRVGTRVQAHGEEIRNKNLHPPPTPPPHTHTHTLYRLRLAARLTLAARFALPTFLAAAAFGELAGFGEAAFGEAAFGEAAEDARAGAALPACFAGSSKNATTKMTSSSAVRSRGDGDRANAAAEDAAGQAEPAAPSHTEGVGVER